MSSLNSNKGDSPFSRDFFFSIASLPDVAPCADASLIATPPSSAPHPALDEAHAIRRDVYSAPADARAARESFGVEGWRVMSEGGLFPPAGRAAGKATGIRSSEDRRMASLGGEWPRPLFRGRSDGIRKEGDERSGCAGESGRPAAGSSTEGSRRREAFGIDPKSGSEKSGGAQFCILPVGGASEGEDRRNAILGLDGPSPVAHGSKGFDGVSKRGDERRGGSSGSGGPVTGSSKDRSGNGEEFGIDFESESEKSWGATESALPVGGASEREDRRNANLGQERPRPVSMHGGEGFDGVRKEGCERGAEACARALLVGGASERRGEGSDLELKSRNENEEGISASVLPVEGSAERSGENRLKSGPGTGIEISGRFRRVSYEEFIKGAQVSEAVEEADPARPSLSGSDRHSADKGEGSDGGEARRFAGGTPTTRAKAVVEIIKMLSDEGGMTVERFTEVDFMDMAECAWDDVCWNLTKNGHWRSAFRKLMKDWRGRCDVEITPVNGNEYEIRYSAEDSTKERSRVAENDRPSALERIGAGKRQRETIATCNQFGDCFSADGRLLSENGGPPSRVDRFTGLLHEQVRRNGGVLVRITAREIFDLARAVWKQFFWIQEDTENWDNNAIAFLRDCNGSRGAGRIDIRVEDSTVLRSESVFIIRGFEGAAKSSQKFGGASGLLPTQKGFSALPRRVGRHMRANAFNSPRAEFDGKLSTITLYVDSLLCEDISVRNFASLFFESKEFSALGSELAESACDARDGDVIFDIYLSSFFRKLYECIPWRRRGDASRRCLAQCSSLYNAFLEKYQLLHNRLPMTLMTLNTWSVNLKAALRDA